MEINHKLRETRLYANYTQEQVAQQIHVSRQTISNWENGKSYPDIISVIMLSDVYKVSLDTLLKGDKKMIEHLNESTNIVNSNKKLICTIVLNSIVVILLFIFNSIMWANEYIIFTFLTLAMISTAILFYQIIRRF